MLTGNMAFESELQKILKEEIEKARDSLESAPFESAVDFEKIRSRLRGLRDVVNIYIPEANAKVEERIRN